MFRISFRWTEWSTPTMTGSVVVICWAVALLMVAGGALLFGAQDLALTAFKISRLLFVVFAVLIALSLTAGLTFVPPSRGHAPAAPAESRRR